MKEVPLAWPEARVYQVLLRLEKARAAAALDDWDGVLATVREAGLLKLLPASGTAHPVRVRPGHPPAS